MKQAASAITLIIADTNIQLITQYNLEKIGVIYRYFCILSSELTRQL